MQEITGSVLQLDFLQMIIAIVCTLAASSGFWMYVMKKTENSDNKTKLLMGLAHDRIIFLGMKYVCAGEVSRDEYEDLVEYLYKPYLNMGGNGTARRIMLEVDKLPVREAQITKPLKESCK